VLVQPLVSDEGEGQCHFIMKMEHSKSNRNGDCREIQAVICNELELTTVDFPRLRTHCRVVS
jgi:hypothetical protein